ncbi:uncharacterized protein [Euwallacea fornicatus]|uniref:uncharacterized protein isoform X2 n=1 Tax=Euwallacea fornicatus TaxID=995702 RepID=UPI00338DDFBC
MSSKEPLKNRKMLLQNEHYNANGTTSSHGTSSRSRSTANNVHYQHHPRLMDSPTLARVERAMLRHEQGTANREGQDIRSGYTQSLLSTSNYGKDSTHAIKRGLLWQQRDKLFSRWKERYFILTRDYLHCFRRASGADRISEMGQFLFKVKLVDVDKVEWENKKTYSTVALVIGRDGKIYLRAPDGLEDWFELLEECMLTSKERRRALRNTHDGRPRDNNNLTASLDEWLAARQKFPMRRLLTEATSTPKQEVTLRRKNWTPRDDDWDHPVMDNRLSLLTDIDINDVNSYDDSTLGAPSVTSYRMSRDILCIQPPSLRQSGSFRSTRENAHLPAKRVANIPDSQCQYIKFRERSYSDIQRIERKPWKALPLVNHHQ